MKKYMGSAMAYGRYRFDPDGDCNDESKRDTRPEFRVSLSLGESTYSDGEARTALQDKARERMSSEYGDCFTLTEMGNFDIQEYDES